MNPIFCVVPYYYPIYTYRAMSMQPYTQVPGQMNMPIRDQGKKPFAVNIKEAAKNNETFRTALWTGEHLQVTLMSLRAGEDISLEVHHDRDQFLRIEAGQGLVQMGSSARDLPFAQYVTEGFAVFVPAGTWHNITNTGSTPLKLYSIYAPPEHPFGTVHRTKAQAEVAEQTHHS